MTPDPAPHRRPSASPAILLLSLLLFGSATFYSGPGPVGGNGPRPERWGAALAWIGRLLILPFDSPGSADIRGLLLPVIAGAAWLWRRPRLACTSAGNDERGRAAMKRQCFEVAGIALCIGAGLSAWHQDCLDYSAGWIVMLASGVAWAAWLRRSLTPATAARAWTAAMLCAAVVFALELWHRQRLGLRYFLWPIGPLTPTAALAALVATSAFGWLTSTTTKWLRRNSPASTAPTSRTAVTVRFGIIAVALVVAASTLWLSGRRAPLLGALLGSAAAAIVLLAACRPRRRVWVAVLAAALVGAAGLATWVSRQASSTQPEVGGSISFRLIYWRESLSIIRQTPWLGRGPSGFAPAMTPRLALRRAEDPSGYGGNFDPEAHNEWLQAVVELGIPLGLAYLALPLSVIAFAARRMIRGGVAPETATALIGGIVAVVVLESAGTSLRHEILSPWYWTCLGLLMAAVQPVAARVTTPVKRRTSPIGLAVGAFLLIVGLLDAYRIREHALATEAMREGQPAQAVLDHAASARGRLGFENWLAVETLQAEVDDTLAERTTQALAGAPASALADEPAVQRAIEAWQTLATRFPRMADHELRLAAALLRAGRAAEARGLVEQCLREIDPYDPRANLMMATHFDTDGFARVQRVVHALRANALDRSMSDVLDTAFRDTPSLAQWRAHIQQLAASSRPIEPPPGDLTPERLRVEAYRLRRAGDLRAAIDAQQAAADTYRLLYEANSHVRRAPGAEWDAWCALADLIWSADPADARRACDAVEWAERFALLGHPHESLRAPPSGGEFFGDEVVPTVTPEALRPLWRLSAKLHLAAGRERNLLYRILLALPPERQTIADAEAEQSALARELAAERNRTGR